MKYHTGAAVKSTSKKLLAACGMLLGMQLTAHAGPILLVTNGILTGATGVEYDGQHYDVSFSDTRPVEGNMAFDSLAATFGASSALDRLVFQGMHDANPGLTNGCTNPLLCFVVTAFEVNGVFAKGAAFTNTASPYADLLLPFAVIGDAANSTFMTYAHWSLQEDVRQAVPEPSTLLLTAAGLAAFLLRHKPRSGMTVA
ncbi:PEP-CTERM sorting domain-containing protein [Massilia dura]|uniref:PEP-CTERM sorting domain-containing protein n=1 Tax=Pseudoduganella dura TaxID=321982 RepID=A0A6I3XJ42_9BURK|nr:PEP-CTERM sorting domain-containing protein [Pseudoduganella dura]GGY07936.1 hypothetical protein GCM10007386_42990 [Pseudoduganella dura]